MIVLAEGDSVTPSDGLVQRRPELEGARGRIICVEEGDSLLVEWTGLPKPYRVDSENLKTAQGD